MNNTIYLTNAATRALDSARNQSAFLVSTTCRRTRQGGLISVQRKNVPLHLLSPSRRLLSDAATAVKPLESPFFQQNRTGEKIALAAILTVAGCITTHVLQSTSSNDSLLSSQDSKSTTQSLSPNDVSAINSQKLSFSSVKELSCTKQLRVAELFDVDWNQIIGRGTYGTAYFGYCKETNERVVIKRISRKVTNDVEFLSERNVLARIVDKGGHPNINRLRDVFVDGENFYLILDFAAGGELFDHIIEHGQYSEVDATLVMEQVASALDFLHKTAGIVHLDLKPENVLLSTSNRSNESIQLIDFGEATVASTDDESTKSTTTRDSIARGQPNTANTSTYRQNSGTTAYWSPERFHQADTDVSSGPSHYDMWSVGVILYIMLTGVHPFDAAGNATDEEVKQRIQSASTQPLFCQDLVGHLSSEAIDLIQKLMQVDPSKRITASEVLLHPWIVKNRQRQAA